ncbi:hypothetical protein NDU88_001251 [Pleurodeles waltl]|uniref:Uncharacterized protein n=1 Tax=Pleurodeles waltl TaxID=8319 RepID=A0AAV7RCF9_PLEWA|nr:hypothetical protein NDU88_001251 [Pleurodeles waltl]
MHTRIPTWENSTCRVRTATDHDKLAEMDRPKKAQMKEYADKRQRAQPSTIRVGDWVLVRREQRRKSDILYQKHPLQVISRKGTMVTAASEYKRETRNIAHFKKCNAPPKEATSGGDSNATQYVPTPASRLVLVISSAVGEPTPLTSASRPQHSRRKPAWLIEEI